MVKAKIAYKGYELTANAVIKGGKKLPQERYYVSKSLGVCLLDEKERNFEIKTQNTASLTPEEEIEYQRLLVIQAKVEKSYADGEWKFRRTSRTEQDIYGPTTTTYERWEHPTYGIVEVTYDGQQWHVPSQYSAENWKHMTLLGRKAADDRRLTFEAWVDYWEMVDSQPKEDPMEGVNAAVKQLEDMGVFPESIVIVDAHQITVKGADAQTHGGKEYYFDADVWFSKTGLEITDTQVQASRRALYAEYKKGLGNKPAKSYEKWLETRGVAAPAPKEATKPVATTPIGEGQRVVHQTWGQGVVARVMGSMLSVKFDRGGVKMVDATSIK